MHPLKASYALDYETIFQYAPVGMCISVDRVIQSANEALASMFCYDRSRSLAGQSFLVLYPTMDEFLRTGDRIVPIMNARGRYSDERIMRRADGELFWCHVSGRALDPRQPLGAGRVDLRGSQRKAAGDGGTDAARARDCGAAGGGKNQQGDRAREPTSVRARWRCTGPS